jgi:hypothetical protein
MKNLSLSQFRTLVAALSAGMLLASCSRREQDHPALLTLEKEIVLSGVEGRIDHFSEDVPGKRPFVAGLGNGTVEVVDLKKGERSAEIKGLKEPQGVYYNAKNGELYVASGGDGTLRIYDGTSLTLRQTLEFGDDADNVRYEARSGHVLVGYGNGGLGLTDAIGQKVRTIPLSLHPESFQLGEGSRPPSSCGTVPEMRLDYIADAMLHALQKGAELPWLYPLLKRSSLAISWATTFATLLLKPRPVGPSM